MDTFGFTRKKWQALATQAQSRHLIAWLIGIYRKLAANRLSKESLVLFTRQYNTILEWSDLNPFSPPAAGNYRDWIEAVSDRIHLHRQASGMTVRDADLLETITTSDRDTPQAGRKLDCHVALDGLRSLFNVGSIFRVCEAAGLASVILADTIGKEDKRVRKTAMGSHQWVHQKKTSDLFSTLMNKKKEGYTVVGIETVGNAVPYHEMNWKEKTIIVLGNEEYGISSHTLPACDQFACLPMAGRKNSVNVGCAAGVICFDIARSLTAQNRDGA